MVVVTGATGHVGGNLVRALLAEGRQVRAVVRDDARPVLDSQAAWLQRYPAVHVRIEGNCDERGTEEYNRSLGERRALAVREELIRLGIDATRVDTTSFGKDKPEDPGHDEAAWKKNRRDDFVVLTPPAK